MSYQAQNQSDQLTFLSELLQSEEGRLHSSSFLCAINKTKKCYSSNHALIFKVQAKVFTGPRAKATINRQQGKEVLFLNEKKAELDVYFRKLHTNL